MPLYTDLEQFLQAHRQHGEVRRYMGQPSEAGYEVRLACPCGVVFNRWVLPQDLPPPVSEYPRQYWQFK